MANFGKDFTLDSQAAFGSDFDFSDNTGVVSVTIENALQGNTGTVTATIQNDIFATGTVTATIENQLNYRTGSVIAGIENRLFETGTVTVTIENDLFLGGVVSATIENELNYRTGTVLAAIKNAVFTASVVSATIENQLTALTGTVSATIENAVYSPSAVSVVVENRLNDQAEYSRWSLSVFVGGVDMSARLTGELSVEMEEGTARLATFDLLPFSGQIDPYSWINNAVIIDVSGFDATGGLIATHRLFTGTVDTPIYDTTTRFTTFTCTDGLQSYIEQRSKAEIAALVGGYHADAVFSETEDRWQYAQQRLSTVAQSFDFDVYGNYRLTDWQAKATADEALTEAHVVHDSLTVSLISRRNIINEVNITLDYRFARKWQREISGGWTAPTPFYNFLSDPYSLPTRDMVLSALDTEWDLASISFNKPPQSGAYTNNQGALVAWGITDDERNQIVWGVNFKLARRWLQDIVEGYQITVKSDASIQQHGVIKNDERYAVDLDVDEEFENPPAVSTQNILSSFSTADSETATGSGYIGLQAGAVPINGGDSIVDPADRSEFDTAVQTAMAEARIQILKAHRANRVSFNTLINPAFDVDKTLDISTSTVSTKGKVRFVKHTLNVNSGEALTEVELAVYQPNVAAQVDDGLSVPTAPDTSVDVTPDSLNLSTYLGGKYTSPAYDPSWTGYIGNYESREIPSEWYPYEFRVDIPAVEDEARDELNATTNVVINTAIPQDVLTINA